MSAAAAGAMHDSNPAVIIALLSNLLIRRSSTLVDFLFDP
jgi:hypothetical protein